VRGAIDVAAVTTSALKPVPPFFVSDPFHFGVMTGARAMTSMQFFIWTLWSEKMSANRNLKGKCGARE